MALALVTGDDAVLISEAVGALVDELVSDGDRSLMVEELTEADFRTETDEFVLTRLVDAARTPPFLTERRVVVGRHLGRFGRKEQYQAIVDLVADELPTTDLVLVWERGRDPQMSGNTPRLPNALKQAVEVAGGRLVITKLTAQNAKAWLDEQLESSDLRFDRDAKKAAAELLGEDRSRVVGLLRTLEGALGPGAEVGASDIKTFGGEEGSVLPWELDDAVDDGDIAAALDALRRLLTSRNPFQILAALHNRYQRMLRLEGAEVAGSAEAAEILGVKGFPAKKLMSQTKKLGSVGVARAMELLAEADLQLRGTVDWPPELVLEVLVARLTALSGRRR